MTALTGTRRRSNSEMIFLRTGSEKPSGASSTTMRSTFGRCPSSLRTNATAISWSEMATAARRPSVRRLFLNTRLSRVPTV